MTARETKSRAVVNPPLFSAHPRGFGWSELCCHARTERLAGTAQSTVWTRNEEDQKKEHDQLRCTFTRIRPTWLPESVDGIVSELMRPHRRVRLWRFPEVLWTAVHSNRAGQRRSARKHKHASASVEAEARKPTSLLGPAGCFAGSRRSVSRIRDEDVLERRSSVCTTNSESLQFFDLLVGIGTFCNIHSLEIREISTNRKF